MCIGRKTKRIGRKTKQNKTKHSVYIGLGTISGFRHRLGVLGHIPADGGATVQTLVGHEPTIR